MESAGQSKQLLCISVCVFIQLGAIVSYSLMQFSTEAADEWLPFIAGDFYSIFITVVRDALHSSHSES